ncbi:response regulator [Neptuniibacter sp. QD57_21]|uniref:hybrid sensor histidine kinase/response regulator n=1 Tax=Neptuniibacter sp. QD57_21 TaxID=3398213 RepID=UPI0039F457DD
MFDPKLAIEWLTAKQKLCLKMELPLTELVVELYEYVDQFSEHNLTGLSDFLALYAELLESLDETQLKQTETVMSEISDKLQGLFSQSPEEVAQGLVTLLQSDDWPEPVVAEDAEFLLELLQDDGCQLQSQSQSQVSDVEQVELTAEVDESNASEADSESPSHPIAVELVELLQAIAVSLSTLSEEQSDHLYDLIDRCSEDDLTGVADTLALYGELLQQIDELEDAQIVTQLNTALINLLQNLNPQEIEPALELMKDSAWVEPVVDEDVSFLIDLLRSDFNTLAGDVALKSSDDVEELVTEPELSIDPIESAASAEQCWPELVPLLRQMAVDIALFEAEYSDQFYDLIDRYSEEDWAGIADMLALYGELLQQLGELEGSHIATKLNSAIIRLLEQPSEQNIDSLLALMNDSAWIEPVPEEDASFLRDLLLGDCQKLGVECDDTAQSELLEPSIEADLPQSSQSDISNKLPALLPLLRQVGEDLDRFEELHSDQFYELIDDYSEDDWTGITDMLALYGELLLQVPELSDLAVVEQLHRAIENLLESADDQQVESVLNLMVESGWSEPVLAEDTDFLKPLLAQDLERLREEFSSSDSCDDEADVVEELVVEELVVEAEASVAILPEAPAFCEIDQAVLEQGSAQVDPAVVTMLSQSIQQLSDQWLQTEIEPSTVEESIDGLETVIRALQTINLNGAKVLVEGLIANLSYLQQHQIPLLEDKINAVYSALNCLLDYFSDLGAAEHQQALLTAFSHESLPCRPTAEETKYITDLFALASLQTSDDLVREEAKPEDVELHESGEIDPQLSDMLYNELPTLSDEYLDSIQQLLDQEHKPALRSAQRAVHTLKGLANMAGIKGLANLAHRLEDVLEFLADQDQLPTGSLKDDLFEASDCLAAMAEAITAGGRAPDNALSTLQLIMDWDYRLKTEGVDALDKEQERTVVEPAVASADDSADVTEKPQASEAEAPAVDSAREENQVFRVPRTVLDTLFRLAGESNTLNAQLDEEVTQLRGFTRTNRERHRNLQRVLFELEQQFSEQMNLQPHLDENADDFDPLEMDRYNEMHTTISRVQEAVADVREVTQEMEGHIHSLSTLHIAQSSLQKETLDNVLSTRQVEVSTISSRLQRILRQVCRSTGKEARLVIQGEDTLVDSNILNQLADPLMHIIRNAVDHGLESTGLRRQRGKPEQGTITLSFGLHDGQIKVSCKDDGDGINTQRVLAVAHDKKLIEPDLPLSSDDVYRLILIPGFSTRDEISQLSGRGIGMDVVYQQILRLQGTLDIQSTSGEGTAFTLAMPASSLMVKTLLVRCGKQVFALSGHGVEQSLISLDGQFQETEEELSFIHEGESYPVFMLENLLHQRKHLYLEPGAVHPVLIVNMAQGERVAVLVKEIIAHRELAFKQMGEYVPDLPGIPGLTILANGEAAPIVDLPARIRHQRTTLSDQPVLIDSDIDLELPRLLVVDDSLSARKSLETLLKDTGYEVMTAIDGLDALNQVRKRQPDLILTDMEMPRMGGVELSTILKNREETAHIPVIMITSRSTDKHRLEATDAGVDVYLTKPWSENYLLDQVESLLAEACV